MGVWVMSRWVQMLSATARGCSALELGSTENTAYCACIATLPGNLDGVPMLRWNSQDPRVASRSWNYQDPHGADVSTSVCGVAKVAK